MSRPLEGIRVVDFGQYLAGPLAALMLADQGAVVIRVDPPGGPRWRHHANAILQRGKRSIVLDLKDTGDANIARRLIAQADVVIENFRPGVMARLGLGAAEMTAANPRVVYCSIPGFAAGDPRAAMPAWENVVEAATAAYTPRQAGGAEVVFSAVPLASNFGAFVAANSILAALIARERCGLGQRVEVPLYNAMFEAIGGQGQKPDPTRFANPSMPLGGIQYECGDGRWIHLFLSVLTPRHFQWFSAAFLPPEWAPEGLLDPERLKADAELSAELRRRMAVIFKHRTAREWEAAINAIGVPASVCYTTAEWLREEQAGAIGAAVTVEDFEQGTTRQAGLPVGVGEDVPSTAQGRHRLDEDRAAILGELGRLEQTPAAAPRGGEAVLSAALEGIKVVDLTQILAGPTATRVLADFGADVIKVNNPGGGAIRGHLYVNSGKKTILLDVASEAGRDVLWRLTAGASVFHQNFRRGTAERLGIGEADVRRREPAIVYSSVSAYGLQGPRGADRGWESLGQAVSGMQERQGGDGPALAQRYQVCDYGTGMLSAFAILTGLFHQARTGEGLNVQASLAQTGTYHQIPFMLDYEGRVWDEPRGPEATGFGPLNRLYRAADRWFALGAPLAEDAVRLASVAGLEGVDFADRPRLAGELERRFATEAAETWVERLRAAGAGAHTVLQLDEVMEDGWAKSQRLSVLRDHAGVGMVRAPGPAPRLSMTPVQVTSPAPLPGWDAQAVLDAAGIGDELGGLLARGVMAEALPGGAEAIT